jgi:excisionase family DNA binding protein
MKRRANEPEPEPPGEIMTMREVADYLHCHYSTLHRLVRQGGLFPVFRLGGDYRCRRADLEKWIAQQRVPVRKSLPPKSARRRRKS